MGLFTQVQASNIYRDVQNQFKFIIPDSWVVESQSSNPLSLVLKPSEDGKIGLNPMIIISSLEGSTLMPKSKSEVQQIVERIKIDTVPNERIKHVKVGDFGIERSEKYYWFYYDTTYEYFPDGKKKKMATRNYVIKSGKNFFSVVLVTPRKKFKEVRDILMSLVRSVESIYSS